jgi:hypothetical protein
MKTKLLKKIRKRYSILYDGKHYYVRDNDTAYSFASSLSEHYSRALRTLGIIINETYRGMFNKPHGRITPEKVWWQKQHK